ncbi:MAG: plasmid pRiA4b ORF-3 family protein [Kastovskya adunca ATA6-11-RM4]|nr:plasmid pRiA4b ORF-3 family protein [Kastovskya adunca ATA6-11-RM4]
MHPAAGAWRYQLRVEAIVSPKSSSCYPVCIGGKGICPKENCGGQEGLYAGKARISSLGYVRTFCRNAKGC